MTFPFFSLTSDSFRGILNIFSTMECARTLRKDEDDVLLRTEFSFASLRVRNHNERSSAFDRRYFFTTKIETPLEIDSR